EAVEDLVPVGELQRRGAQVGLVAQVLLRVDLERGALGAHVLEGTAVAGAAVGASVGPEVHVEVADHRAGGALVRHDRLLSVGWSLQPMSNVAERAGGGTIHFAAPSK